MKTSASIEVQSNAATWLGLAALAAATGWLASTATSHGMFILCFCAAILYVLFALTSFGKPLVFVLVYLVVLITIPPFFFRQTGDTPLYVSSFLLPIALAVLLARWPDFHFHFDPIAKGLFLFLMGTGISLPFACWFSGTEIATAALLRWLMLAQTLVLYMLVRGGMRSHSSPAERWLVPILFLAGAISAAYGIYDFIWPVPIPHPAAPEFIFLPNGMVRRAQGVFYESSSFANICGFFLAAAAGAFLVRKEKVIGISRPLLPPFILILTGAVIVAFSRSSWANVFVTLLVFSLLTRRTRWRRTLILFVALALPFALLAFYFPEVWGYFLGHRLGSLTLLLSDPNSASSGRYDVWAQIAFILYQYPHYFVLGIGYKTLPFTKLFKSGIVADNGFLSLLLETGIMGLSGFIAFLIATLKEFWKLSKSRNNKISYWATFLFAFWCGQCVQLLAVDSYTFWRNMVVYVS